LALTSTEYPYCTDSSIFKIQIHRNFFGQNSFQAENARSLISAADFGETNANIGRNFSKLAEFHPKHKKSTMIQISANLDDIRPKSVAGNKLCAFDRLTVYSVHSNFFGQNSFKNGRTRAFEFLSRFWSNMVFYAPIWVKFGQFGKNSASLEKNRPTWTDFNQNRLRKINCARSTVFKRISLQNFDC
jgi:hypothetical protein